MNINESNNLIFGAVHGVHIKQHHDILHNDLIYNRNIPDEILRPNLSFHATTTRQTLFPTAPIKREASVPIYSTPGHCVHTKFSPATRMGPTATYLANIDIETKLQGRVYALQRGDESVYVPNSSSDLYNTHVEAGAPLEQPYPLLFEKQEYKTRGSSIATKIGNDQLYNNTRVQLKTIG